MTGKWISAILMAVMMPAGAAIAQDGDILKNAINTPSIAYSFYGSGQSAKIARDTTVSGGQIYRVTVTKGKNAYDAGASFSLIKPIAKGDRIVIAFWGRAPKLADGATTPLPFAGIIGPAPGFATVIGGAVQLDKDWKLRQLSGIASGDYGAGQASVTLHLAAENAVIELGPMFVLDMGPKR